MMLPLPHPKRLMIGHLSGAIHHESRVRPGGHHVSLARVKGREELLTSAQPRRRHRGRPGRVSAGARRGEGRDGRRRRRRARRKATRARGGSPRSRGRTRMLGNGSAVLTFIVGAAMSFPGAIEGRARPSRHRAPPPRRDLAEFPPARFAVDAGSQQRSHSPWTVPESLLMDCAAVEDSGNGPRAPQRRA